jgi:hypothetical protein
MRYRRENKKMVERLRLNGELTMDDDAKSECSGSVDNYTIGIAPSVKQESIEDDDEQTAQSQAAAAAAAHAETIADQAAVEAAVAAAESFKTEHGMDDHMVHNPLDAAALDAAAKLAAATGDHVYDMDSVMNDVQEV